MSSDVASTITLRGAQGTPMGAASGEVVAPLRDSGRTRA